MNVTFGLVAAWFAFCLATVGVKGRGQNPSLSGSDQFDTATQPSLGGTLVLLLRGTWPYGYTPAAGQGPYIDPGGNPTPPYYPHLLPPGTVPVPSPNAPGSVGLQPPPAAGSVNL